MALTNEEARRLDCEVAERVMGWTNISLAPQNHNNVMDYLGVRPGEVPSKFTGFLPKFVIPKYSTEIAAAWELVGRLDYQWSINKQVDGSCTVGIFERTNLTISEKCSAGAKTAPEAICLAALRALGGDVSGDCK